MKDIALLFKELVTTGYYTKHHYSMRTAVRAAKKDGMFTSDVEQILLDTLSEYLQNWSGLHAALKHSGLPCNPHNFLDVFTDWDNRPELFHLNLEGGEECANYPLSDSA